MFCLEIDYNKSYQYVQKLYIGLVIQTINAKLRNGILSFMLVC